jgi:cell division protein FtsN
MSRDYKHRANQRDSNNRRNSPDSSGIGLFRWMLITALVIGFVVFLVYLKSPGFNKAPPGPVIANLQSTTATKTGKNQDTEASVEQKTEAQKPQPPQFDFYNILPKKEVVVPDYEIKTRTREEQVGKNKKTSYVMQAGSFKTFDEADQLKAKLALMGIESKIQKAKVESVTWYRVKIGPYSQMNSVNTLMSRMKKHGLKPVITEVDG